MKQPAPNSMNQEPKFELSWTPLNALAALLLVCIAQAAGDTNSPGKAAFSDANWSSMGGVPGTDGPVYAALTDDSGGLYVGGAFGTVADTRASAVAQWNGGHWSALGSGLNGAVMALAKSGSNLYAGGWFTAAGATAVDHIAKWDGSAWSPLGLGLTDTVVPAARR